jgi:hypothetical protein
MSGHEKKARPLRQPGKSPIATPPPARLQGRSKTDCPDENASTKSTPDGNASDTSETDSPGKGKDKKIAALEKELATMVDEFDRELTTLSHKLTNESETANFWQQKHSSLNQTFLKTDTELRLLRQEVSGFEQVKESRDRDIKTRISSLMLDRDAFREAYNEAMGELRVKEEVIKSLQGQVRGLKSFVSTSSKMDEQVTDEAFGERMQRLGNGLQNWVITNFRRVKIGMSIPPPGFLTFRFLFSKPVLQNYVCFWNTNIEIVLEITTIFLGWLAPRICSWHTVFILQLRVLQAFFFMRTSFVQLGAKHIQTPTRPTKKRRNSSVV